MANTHDILDQKSSSGITAYRPVKVSNSLTIGIKKFQKEFTSDPNMRRFKQNLSLETIRTDPEDEVNETSDVEMEVSLEVDPAVED